ncbi:MAG: thioredoxin [Betaproteobacteria bacterium]|jgi:thioredoxin-related protein|nr:thioredoxin [Betaproteobacteria bacterium]
MKMTNYWRQLRLWCLILTCTIGAACAQTQFPPLRYADDFASLGREAAAGNKPIMLVFTRPGCPYCATAKHDHLEPLAASAEAAAKVVLREVEAPNEMIPLRDFDGKMTTHADFARRYEVRVVPTVILVDSAGAPLTDAIVGLNLPEFYNLYIEQAIDAARLRLRTR